MSTSTFQHRPPAIRNLGERIFARGSGRASRFVTDRLAERASAGSVTGSRSQIQIVATLAVPR